MEQAPPIQTLWTMKDITVMLGGVHRNTVMNRLKGYEFLLTKEQRKRYYNEDEVQLIKKLFNVK